MKKTQKIFALLIAVLMVFSCFSTVVLAEDETEEMITVVSATEISKNAYIIEFSAPVHFHAINQIFRRHTTYYNADAQQYDKTVEYVGETSEVDGKTYSTKVKITFAADVADTFDQGKYGILFAEYTDSSTTEHLGAIAPSIISGANGELVKANFTNSEATPLDFVWLPTGALDPTGTYAPTLKNAEDIRLLSADVSADKTTYTLHFSAPVSVGSKGSIWFRVSAENGTGQVNPGSVEYVGTTVTYNDKTYSDTIKLVIDPDGGKAEATGNKTFREASSDLTNYGISFTEYKNSSATHAGYVYPNVITGIRGQMVKGNYASGGRDFLWVPTYTVDTGFTYKTHLNFGAPYVVSATKILANTPTVRVEFSEPVNFHPYNNWKVILRENSPESATQSPMASKDVTYVGETVTKDGKTYGKVLEFKFNDLSSAFDDEKYGITFVEYNDAENPAGAKDGVITTDIIYDVDGNGLTANYVNGIDFAWFPTDALDTANTYPIHLEIERAPEKIEVATYEELVTALATYSKQTIYVTADLVANEGITYEYDEQSGKVLVVDAEGSIVAAYGTGNKGTTAGQLIEGSIADLDVWTPFTVKNNVVDFQGHKVSGWVLGAANGKYGLFDAIDMTGTVKNINIENVFTCVNGVASARVGALAAQNWGVVENVQIKDAIIITADSQHNNVGLAIGYMSSSKAAQKENFNPTVYNVTTDGYLFTSYLPEKSATCIGGIVGKSNGGKIMNCVNYADIYQTGSDASKTSYGTGGIVGLVETAAGGPFNEQTDLTQKTLENFYIVNNANYGKIEVLSGMIAGGIIGYADPIWSAGSSITVANNFNGGKIVGGKSGIVGRSQDVSSLGSITTVYEFNFDDIANGNPFVQLGTTFTAKVVRIATQADALENLNRNVGNYQAVNGEATAKAWAWENVDGKILPVATAKVGEVKDATPVALPEYTFDPETEVGILGAKLVSPYVIEVTFSEPVVPGSLYTGIRYVDLSTGVPQLIYADLDGGGTANDVAQFDSTTIWTDGNKAYFKIQNNRATAVSNDTLDIVSGAGFGDKISGHEVAFCIEGVPVKNGDVLVEGSNEVGYIDTITSVDGTKKLKASPGKAHASGTYDGVYVAIENPYEDGDFINPEASDEYVVLEGAELAGPHSLKLQFSEPVKLVDGTKAWLSIRYCKFAADGYTPNYMIVDNKPCQVGITITEDNFECEEDGTYVVTFGNDVDMRAIVNGEAWEGADAILISIEQLPAQIEDYNGSIGFLDNIVSLDGGKMLAASPAKMDVSKNAEGEYGPYDGAYAEIAAHECAYTEVGGDEDYHWNECICGTADEDSIEAHDFSIEGRDDEEHWLECACGAVYADSVEAHDYTVADKDASSHWNKCECGAINEDSITAHDYTVTDKDADSHWYKCECGAINEDSIEDHDYGDGDTCGECGNKKYVTGDLTGNDEVEADDAIYLLYNIFFGDEDYPVQQPIDFNNDGETDANDAIYLLYHVFFGDEDYPLFPVVQ